MCGHVGIAGQLTTKDEVILRTLLLLDYNRGKDATGFASVRERTREIRVAKQLGNPFNLFDSKGFETALNGNMSQVFIGHNRAKTIGSNTVFNSHPFEYDHIVGAHNGTLSLTQCDFDGIQEHGVDSQYIIDSISKKGIKETVKGMVGAWALVWYDQLNHTINFLRNKERPLWWAKSKDCKKLYWASEWQMLDAAITVHGNAQEDLWCDERGYRYFPFEEDILYTQEIPENLTAALGVFKTYKGYEGKPAKTYTYSPTIWNKGNRVVTEVGGTTNRGESETKKETEKIGKTTTSTLTTKTGSHLNGGTTTSANRVVNLFPTSKDVDKDDPYLGQISKEDFDKATQYGCSFCGADIIYGDVGIEIWHKDDPVCLCAKCRAEGGEPSKTTRINKVEINKVG